MYENGIFPAASSSRYYKIAADPNSYQPSQNQPPPEASRMIDRSIHAELAKPVLNAVVALASEAAAADHGVLVFCSSRAGCESDAVIIAQTMTDFSDVNSAILERRRDLLEDLRNTTTGLDPTLEQTLPFGVGFHHAGLTTEERELIADAYDNGTIKVLVATCTLAAGINLPARRVILHGARMGRELVGPSMLRQMRGRAGRKGKDEIGETYLCCQKTDIEAVAELMEADLPQVTSCLSSDSKGTERALLEVIATKLATSPASIDDYMRKTLLFQTLDETALLNMVKETLQGLVAMGLVDQKEGIFQATMLGQAIVASSLSPPDGVFIHRELSKAVQAFVLDGEMHILYAFTPIQPVIAEVNWQIFRNELEKLDESGLRVLDFVGIKPTVINNL